jgi:hypothetical protein
MDLVRQGALPIHFGSPHPTVAIVEQEGTFRIRALEIDAAEARAKQQEAFAAKRGWMPEQHYALGKPTGRIFLEVATREALLEAIATMPWPADW